jgi:hydrogenase maturation protease
LRRCVEKNRSVEAGGFAVRVLVAGIGNIFLGDDGFGSAVAAQLCAKTWPDGVQVADYGIRGMDLAFALTSGIDAAILVDAVARGGEPGTLYVIEPDAASAVPVIENHAMDPARVLAFAATLGTLPTWVRVLGCEPARLGGDEDEAEDLGLSEAVQAAIPSAVEIVERLVREAACTS